MCCRWPFWILRLTSSKLSVGNSVDLQNFQKEVCLITSVNNPYLDSFEFGHRQQGTCTITWRQSNTYSPVCLELVQALNWINLRELLDQAPQSEAIHHRADKTHAHAHMLLHELSRARTKSRTDSHALSYLVLPARFVRVCLPPKDS